MPIEFQSIASDILKYLSHPYARLGFYALGIFVIFVLIISFVKKILRNPSRLFQAFQKTVLLVKVPKSSLESVQGKHLKDLIGPAETIFTNLGGLRPPKGWKTFFFGRHDHIALEIVAGSDGIIYFYAVVPKENQSFVEKQIQAQYPEVSIEEAPDYNIFSPKGFILGTNLILKREPIFPIVSFNRADSDPLNALTNSMSKLGMKNGATIQILIRPTVSKWYEQGRKVASEMQQGRNLKEAVRRAYASKIWKFVGDAIWEIFSKKDQAGGQKEQYRLSPKEEETVKLLEEKAGKPGFDVNVRAVVSAETWQIARVNLDNIVNSFAQYGYADGNGFRSAPTSNFKNLIRNFVYRGFDEKRKFILNTEEMITLYHLPLPTTETPNINWLKAAKAPPPPNMPAEGITLGSAIYRGQETLVKMTKDDRRRHLYVIGQTGTGKSALLKKLIMQDMENGEGVCVMDPHGELAEEILEIVPKNRIEDIVYFNPADMDRPLGLNMLEYRTDEQKDFVVGEMIAIFYKLFGGEMIGPMFEHYMRNAMLALMEDKESGATLIEIPRMFTDEDFRRKKVAKVKNPIVKSFWEQEYEQSQKGSTAADMLTYVISKIGRILTNDMMRNIMGQAKSAFDFREIMDQQKILIVNLSKGTIGEINSSLLGMVIVTKLQAAAMSRGDVAERQRKDFYLYIDEFQNFVTQSVESILSEARKFRLCLIIAHQYLGQLIQQGGQINLRDAVLGNVGSKIAFRVGVEDAETLAKEFAPVFNQNDVINIENLNANVKMLINDVPTKPFNLKIIFAPRGVGEEKARAIKELSRLKHGRDRKIVEAEIEERAKLSELGKGGGAIDFTEFTPI